jgi:hypothetical protein
VAAGGKAVRETGFCFPKGAAGGVCGWVFLARVSEAEAFAAAEESGGVLGGEALQEQGAGPGGDPDFAEAGVEGVAGVGVRSGEEALAASGSAGEAGVGADTDQGGGGRDCASAGMMLIVDCGSHRH